MADERIVNGLALDGDDQTGENFYDFDRENEATKVSDLIRKIEVLEHDKLELVRDNEETREKMKKLTAEIAGLRNDEVKMKERLGEMEILIERSESDKKAAKSIAARAVELETVVARTQHDLISAMSEGDEAKAEVKELKKVLEEKESSLERIEREKQLLKQGLEKEIREVMKAKSMIESKVRELEKIIEGLEERENERKKEKLRIEEEAKAKIDEKEKEICGLKKGIEELKAAIAKSGLELEKEKKEKKEMEVLKNGVEEALRVSEEKVKEMEAKMIQLQKQAVDVEKVTGGLKEKSVEAINGIAIKGEFDDESKGSKGLNLQWLAAAGTGTVIVAGAVCYLKYARQR